MTNGNDFVVAQTKDSDGMWCQPKGGLTKREYFAGLAMQGMLANPALVDGDESLELNDDDAKDMGKWSVAMADALLKALSPDGGASE